MLVAGPLDFLPLVVLAFRPWAVRPALRCPAAGEGPHGRQQRSAVKLTPMIMARDYGYVTIGNGRGFGRTESIFMDGRSGPTMLYRRLFFLMARIPISG